MFLDLFVSWQQDQPQEEDKIQIEGLLQDHRKTSVQARNLALEHSILSLKFQVDEALLRIHFRPSLPLLVLDFKQLLMMLE